jgi:hypothetical protein
LGCILARILLITGIQPQRIHQSLRIIVSHFGCLQGSKGQSELKDGRVLCVRVMEGQPRCCVISRSHMPPRASQMQHLRRSRYEMARCRTRSAGRNQKWSKIRCSFREDAPVEKHSPIVRVASAVMHSYLVKDSHSTSHRGSASQQVLLHLSARQEVIRVLQLA